MPTGCGITEPARPAASFRCSPRPQTLLPVCPAPVGFSRVAAGTGCSKPGRVPGVAAVRDLDDVVGSRRRPPTTRQPELTYPAIPANDRFGQPFPPGRLSEIAGSDHHGTRTAARWRPAAAAPRRPQTPSKPLGTAMASRAHTKPAQKIEILASGRDMCAQVPGTPRNLLLHPPVPPHPAVSVGYCRRRHDCRIRRSVR
jgi:hypothetical protein